jgi:hypothetical protein
VACWVDPALADIEIFIDVPFLVERAAGFQRGDILVENSRQQQVIKQVRPRSQNFSKLA